MKASFFLKTYIPFSNTSPDDHAPVLAIVDKRYEQPVIK